MLCDEERAFQHTEQHRDTVLLIFLPALITPGSAFCNLARLLLILPPLFRIIVYRSTAFGAQSERQHIYNIKGNHNGAIGTTPAPAHAG